MLEQQSKRGRRLAVATEHQAAGRILVQSVRQHRRSRQAKTKRVEGRFQVGPALGTPMHWQSGRFVDDQHQPVAVEDARLDLFDGQFGNIEQGQDFRSRLSFASRNG